MDYGNDRGMQRGMSGATLYGPDSTQPKLKTENSYFNDSPGSGSNEDAPLPQPRPRFAQANGEQRISFAPPKSTGDLRIWRHDERGNMWIKGGKRRTVLRFCCCTLFMTLLLIISIILTLAMWARPPDIFFNGIQTPTDRATVTAQVNSLDINLDANITVRNPNYFGASFKSIIATAYYPPITSPLGGGALYDINFPANHDTTFLFPINITWSASADPNQTLVTDLVDKCGIKDPSSKTPLTIKYDIKLALRVTVFTISPSFSGTANVDCPVTRADIESFGGDALLKSLGVD